MSIPWLSCVCQRADCGKSFSWRRNANKNTKMPPPKFCSDRCRNKDRGDRMKGVGMGKPRGKSERHTREKTLRCEVCNTLKTFPTDGEGRTLEACRCGVSRLGAVPGIRTLA